MLQYSGEPHNQEWHGPKCQPGLGLRSPASREKHVSRGFPSSICPHNLGSGDRGFWETVAVAYELDLLLLPQGVEVKIKIPFTIPWTTAGHVFTPLCVWKQSHVEPAFMKATYGPKIHFQICVWITLSRRKHLKCDCNVMCFTWTTKMYTSERGSSSYICFWNASIALGEMFATNSKCSEAGIRCLLKL